MLEILPGFLVEVHGSLVQHVRRAQDVHCRASQTDLEGTKAEGNKAGHDGLLIGGG